MPSRLKAPTVRTVTLLVLVLPVALVITLAASYAAEVSGRAQRADSVVEAATVLDDLVRLRTAVVSEGRWATVMIKLDELGVDPALARLVIGFDVSTELSDNGADVDRYRDLIDDPTFGTDLDAARAAMADGSADLPALDATYERLAAVVSARVDGELHLVGSAVGGGGVLQAGTLADSAARWQSALADQVWGWLGVKAGFIGGEADPSRLLVEGALQAEALAERIEQSLEEGSNAEAAWNAPAGSLAVTRLQASYDLTIQSLIDGEIGGELDGEPDVDALLSQIGELVAVTDLSTFVADHALTVVDAALFDLADAAEAERSAAIGAQGRALLLGGAVILGLAFLVAAVTWMLIRPLGQIARVAAALQQGSLDERAAVAGPRETRLAAQSLNDAVDQLKLAERQALALAEERLDDPVLEASVPGQLGASLRQAVAHLHQNLTDRDHFQRRLTHEALHDPLTQLPNRRATLEQLDRALARTRRAGKPAAVLFIDIDRFKDVNDVYGHAAGDLLLKQVASRLRAATRSGDVVGRLGGDEFLVVAEPIATPEDAATVAAKLVDALAEPVDLGDVVYRPSASIGVAVTDDEQSSGDELIRAADLALYRAKERGRGGFEVCDTELDELRTSRAEIVDALADAIDRDELCLHYQPVVDADTHRIVSVEAFVRWERPGVGLSSAGDFVPIAEGTELITRLDRWVVREAVRQLAVWDSNPACRALRIAVNVSARELARPSFPETVLGAIADLGVDPARLTIEVSEAAIVEDTAPAIGNLEAVSAAGVQIALDDFGTGYASLGHLRSLPIDTIKIDRMFVSEVGAAGRHPFVSLVVDTGRLLGATVVGEGVETAAQAAALRDGGCDMLQGYRFGAPMPASELADLLQPART